MKGYQYRYYVRMREIEYTAYLINRVHFDSREYGNSEISAPRIDMMWPFRGYLLGKDNNPLADDRGKPWPHPPWRRVPRPPKKPKPNAGEAKSNADWRADEPWRRNPEEIYKDLRHRWWWPNVMLPHVVAVVLGSALLIIFAWLNLAGVQPLAPVSAVLRGRRNSSIQAQASLHRHAPTVPPPSHIRPRQPGRRQETDKFRVQHQRAAATTHSSDRTGPRQPSSLAERPSATVLPLATDQKAEVRVLTRARDLLGSTRTGVRPFVVCICWLPNSVRWLRTEEARQNPDCYVAVYLSEKVCNVHARRARWVGNS